MATRPQQGTPSITPNPTSPRDSYSPTKTRTVDHHVSALLAKLGVTTRREAVHAAAAFEGRRGRRS
jgi:hypothetical protein